jgi:short-subunit dehydrogenase
MKPAGMNVLLTGASGGIGHATALALAGRGAKLLLAGRNEASLGKLCDRIVRAGGTARYCVADITDPEGRADLVAAANRDTPRINVLINNAGSNCLELFSTQSDATIESILSTNVAAPMLLTKALLPTLLAAPEARIVNIGSILGSIATPGQLAYSTTKFALHGFTEALRRELSDTAVRVVYVAPRATDTAMNQGFAAEMNSKLGVRMDSPGRVAAQIVAALEAGSRERFIGWPERLFVKVNALFPGLVDRSLRRQLHILNKDGVAGNEPALEFGADT